MSLVDQGELTLTRRADSNAVPIEMIRVKKTSGAAFTLACDSSGLDDKEIHMSLNIDAGTFSRIKKGTNTLNADQITSFCRIVGNTIYPEWLAFQVGCTLVMIQSESERLRAEAIAQLEEERMKNKLLMQLFQGKAA
jgi:hypothetical protein